MAAGRFALGAADVVPAARVLVARARVDYRELELRQRDLLAREVAKIDEGGVPGAAEDGGELVHEPDPSADETALAGVREPRQREVLERERESRAQRAQQRDTERQRRGDPRVEAPQTRARASQGRRDAADVVSPAATGPLGAEDVARLRRL